MSGLRKLLLFTALLILALGLAGLPALAQVERTRTLTLVVDRGVIIQRPQGLVVARGIGLLAVALDGEVDLRLRLLGGEGVEELELSPLKLLYRGGPVGEVQGGYRDRELAILDRYEEVLEGWTERAREGQAEPIPLSRMLGELEGELRGSGQTVVILAARSRLEEGPEAVGEVLDRLNRPLPRVVLAVLGKGELADRLSQAGVEFWRLEPNSPVDLLWLLSRVSLAEPYLMASGSAVEVPQGSRRLIMVRMREGEDGLGPFQVLGPEGVEADYLSWREGVGWLRLSDLVAVGVERPGEGQWWLYRPARRGEAGRRFDALYFLSLPVEAEFRPTTDHAVMGEEFGFEVTFHTPSPLTDRMLMRQAEVGAYLLGDGRVLAEVGPREKERTRAVFSLTLPPGDYTQAELVVELRGDFMLYRRRFTFQVFPPTRVEAEVAGKAEIWRGLRGTFRLVLDNQGREAREVRLGASDGFRVEPESLRVRPGRSQFELILVSPRPLVNLGWRELAVNLWVEPEGLEGRLLVLPVRVAPLPLRYPLASFFFLTALLAGLVGLGLRLHQRRLRREFLCGTLTLVTEQGGERSFRLEGWRRASLTLGVGEEVDLPVPRWKRFGEGVYLTLQKTPAGEVILIAHRPGLEVEGEELAPAGRRPVSGRVEVSFNHIPIWIELE